MRLKDRIAIVIGIGQQPGETISNGRATAIRFTQEGATVLLVGVNAAGPGTRCRGSRRRGKEL
jgi:NAD(P)-dependent dehydrogenase (short-subunit alcohol dehydrogenase family)